MVTRISSLLFAALLNVAAPQSFAASDSAQPQGNATEIPAMTGEVQTQAYRTYYYNFGSWPVGSYVYHDFYLTTRGGTSRIYSIYTYGSSFKANDNCPTRLYRGTSCTIRVYFQPWYEGYQNGNTVVSTAAGTMTIYLSGYGY